MGRVRGNYSRLEVEAFRTHQVQVGQRLFCPQTSALSPTHSMFYIFLHFHSSWTILHSTLHCVAVCPVAVQTSPYFLFNSFASRKSDSNTSPRKHKYVSPGTAFHIVPQQWLEKFGPQMGLSRKHKYAAAAAAMLGLTYLI